MAPSSSFGSSSPARIFQAAISRSESRAGVADADRAVRPGQRLDAADLDARDAGLLAEGLVAAGVRCPDDEGRSALRNAHRLDGEARHELAGDVEQGRELTDHEIAVRNEVHGTKAGRSLAESVERQDGAGEARQERPGVIAGGRESGLDGRPRALIGEGHPKHDPPFRDRVRKLLVAGRFLSIRRPLRLGEQHVEDDGGGARAGEVVDQLCDPRARPRPLPEPPQRFVVDRDDADRALGIVNSGRPALESVEFEVAERPDAEGFPQGQDRAEHERNEGGEEARRPKPPGRFRPCEPRRFRDHAGTLACSAAIAVYCPDWSA